MELVSTSINRFERIESLPALLHARKVQRRAATAGFDWPDFSGPLAPIRALRNRIAHHEPIIEWDLPKHYAKMIEISGWLCPTAADWCEVHSRFLEAYPREGITLCSDDRERG